MSFLSYPPRDRRGMNAALDFNIRGIPNLKIINAYTGETITENGSQDIYSKGTAAFAEWASKVQTRATKKVEKKEEEPEKEEEEPEKEEEDETPEKELKDDDYDDAEEGYEELDDWHDEIDMEGETCDEMNAMFVADGITDLRNSVNEWR
jgi:hypothetical protein